MITIDMDRGLPMLAWNIAPNSKLAVPVLCSARFLALDYNYMC
jgi:hypothetical protein